MNGPTEEWPVDASSLIYLAKTDAFGKVTRCVGRLLITPGAWEEAVVAGEEIGAPEVGRIRASVTAGMTRRVALLPEEEAFARTLAGSRRIGRGESEVISVGRRFGRCVVDEGR